MGGIWGPTARGQLRGGTLWPPNASLGQAWCPPGCSEGGWREATLDTKLSPQGASALFDMIEYYESATHLNISFNKHIGTRGWQAAAHMMRKVGAPSPGRLSSTPGSLPSLHLGQPIIPGAREPPSPGLLCLVSSLLTGQRFGPSCPLYPADQLPAVPGRPQHTTAGPFGTLRGPRPAHPQQPGRAAPGER